MGFRLEGFDDMQRKLKDLADRAERLDGEHKVSFDDLFTTDFMRRFTDFLTLQEMFAASGYKVESTADFEQIPDTEWDAFIQKNTLFENWAEMRDKAVGEWTSRQLGFSE